MKEVKEDAFENMIDRSRENQRKMNVKRMNIRERRWEDEMLDEEGEKEKEWKE